jgi:hypothetical protein
MIAKSKVAAVLSEPRRRGDGQTTVLPGASHDHRPQRE